MGSTFEQDKSIKKSDLYVPYTLDYKHIRLTVDEKEDSDQKFGKRSF